jgi:FkbM family methyltransferase
MCRYRAQTFSFKEPETLAWIDRFEQGAVFWDIGANVGLYSIYAAKTRRCQVYAFEPSVFNLEFLARNASLNGLARQVYVVPFAVGDRTGTGELHMSSTEWGGALSTFDKTYGYDGKELTQVFEYSTISVSIDEAVSRLGLPPPLYLKIDVDGIEHLILAGGFGALSTVKGVLVEISNGFREQAVLVKKYLQDAGLVLKESHADSLAGSAASEESGTVNQIWARPE